MCVVKWSKKWEAEMKLEERAGPGRRAQGSEERLRDQREHRDLSGRGQLARSLPPQSEQRGRFQRRQARVCVWGEGVGG